MIGDYEIGLLADAIGRAAGDAPNSNMANAQVVGTDSNGKTLVRVFGSNTVTPVHSTTVELASGDTVSVMFEGDRLSVVGNVANPSAGTQRVAAVEITAEKASKEAVAASTAAFNAIQSAEVAAVAATSAQTSADEASAAASTAQANADQALGAADEARGSAVSANAYALNALAGLGEVEDVVGVLNWMADHATPTQDSEPIDGKTYYQRDGDGKMTRAEVYEYSETQDSEPQGGKTYYVEQDGEYVEWRGEFEEGATYYERSAKNPASEGYWELGEAVSEFMAAHAAMDSYGLNVFGTSSGYRLHIGTLNGGEDGFYIINELGEVVGKYGETTQTGLLSDTHIEMRPDRMSFWQAGWSYEIALEYERQQRSDPTWEPSIDDAMQGEVAFIASDDNGDSVFYMNRAVVVNELRFAMWKWVPRDNGNLSLKWMGE